MAPLSDRKSDDTDRWYFKPEQLMNTPSHKHMSHDKEIQNRQAAANFIQDMGQKLHVTQLTINTAIVYMHRFYVFHSFHRFDWAQMAAAALFLAAKVEEQPRKLEHIIKISQLCLGVKSQGQGTSSSGSGSGGDRTYAEMAQDLVWNENILLQTLGFDVKIHHPHTYVVQCCHLIGIGSDISKTAYFMASNSLHLTTMCLEYKPTVVACFCIHIACKWSNWSIPLSVEDKPWYWYTDKTVSLELIEKLTTDFLDMFEKWPSKLKRRITAMDNLRMLDDFGKSCPGSGSQQQVQSESRHGNGHHHGHHQAQIKNNSNQALGPVHHSNSNSINKDVCSASGNGGKIEVAKDKVGNHTTKPEIKNKLPYHNSHHHHHNNHHHNHHKGNAPPKVKTPVKQVAKESLPPTNKITPPPPVFQKDPNYRRTDVKMEAPRRDIGIGGINATDPGVVSNLLKEITEKVKGGNPRKEVFNNNKDKDKEKVRELAKSEEGVSKILKTIFENPGDDGNFVNVGYVKPEPVYGKTEPVYGKMEPYVKAEPMMGCVKTEPMVYAKQEQTAYVKPDVYVKSEPGDMGKRLDEEVVKVMTLPESRLFGSEEEEDVEAPPTMTIPEIPENPFRMEDVGGIPASSAASSSHHHHHKKKKKHKEKDKHKEKRHKEKKHKHQKHKKEKEATAMAAMAAATLEPPPIKITIPRDKVNIPLKIKINKDGVIPLEQGCSPTRKRKRDSSSESDLYHQQHRMKFPFVKTTNGNL